MRRTVLIPAVLLAGLVLALAACGSDDDGEGAGEAQVGGEVAMVELQEQNDSGESGTAELRDEGGETIVEISLDGAPASEPQPAHIHKGTCDDLNPQPEYGLDDVIDGRSTTSVSATLEKLKSGGYAINVHKSVPEASVYVACGNLGGGTGTDGSDEGGIGY
jgi:hypothetical protein